MSTKTFDTGVELPSTKSAEKLLAAATAPITNAATAFGRAVTAAHLVERGVDPREVYEKIYKTQQ